MWAGFVAILYRVWNYVDVPKGIPVNSYNRLGSGLLAGTLIFTASGLVECIRVLKDSADTLRIEKGKSCNLVEYLLI
jgi:hypothetical protein